MLYAGIFWQEILVIILLVLCCLAGRANMEECDLDYCNFYLFLKYSEPMLIRASSYFYLNNAHLSTVSENRQNTLILCKECLIVRVPLWQYMLKRRCIE